MFRSIDLANIRLFEGAGWHFDLRPLTVFCGTNSSGKSTVLKSLLLLQQTISVRDVTQKRKNQIKFVGELTDLGDFRSFVSHNDQARDVSISVAVDFRPDAWGSRSLFGTKNQPSKPHELCFEATFTFGLVGAIKNPGESTASPPVSPAILKLGEYKITGPTNDFNWSVAAEKGDSPRAAYSATLPGKLFDTEFGGLMRSQPGLTPKKTNGDSMTFDCSVDGLTPQNLILRVPAAKSKTTKGRKTAISEYFFPFPHVCTDAMQTLVKALSRLDHLGPLRAPARRYYVTTLDSSPQLDPTGEFIAYTLREMAETQVACVMPKSRSVSTVELAVALNSWLHYLRTGSEAEDDSQSREIKVATTRNVLVECLLASNNGREAHSLADSGFGYSQVLPMVIKLLMAPKDSTTIIEQPELHLNPSLQVRVAEFLVACVRSGRQVLVETHSEHIVNTMRALTAEDAGGKLNQEIIIYFIDSSDVLPEVTSMSIGKDGSISDWPPVFFGEAIDLSSRLLRAQKPRTPSKARP